VKRGQEMLAKKAGGWGANHDANQVETSELFYKLWSCKGILDGCLLAQVKITSLIVIKVSTVCFC